MSLLTFWKICTFLLALLIGLIGFYLFAIFAVWCLSQKIKNALGGLWQGVLYFAGIGIGFFVWFMLDIVLIDKLPHFKFWTQVIK